MRLGATGSKQLQYQRPPRLPFLPSVPTYTHNTAAPVVSLSALGGTYRRRARPGSLIRVCGSTFSLCRTQNPRTSRTAASDTLSAASTLCDKAVSIGRATSSVSARTTHTWWGPPVDHSSLFPPRRGKRLQWRQMGRHAAARARTSGAPHRRSSTAKLKHRDMTWHADKRQC